MHHGCNGRVAEHNLPLVRRCRVVLGDSHYIALYQLLNGRKALYELGRNFRRSKRAHYIPHYTQGILRVHGAVLGKHHVLDVVHQEAEPLVGLFNGIHYWRG